MDTNLTLSEPSNGFQHLSHLIQAHHTCLKVISKPAKTKCDKLDAKFPRRSNWMVETGWTQTGIHECTSESRRPTEHFPHGHFNRKKELKRRSREITEATAGRPSW